MTPHAEIAKLLARCKRTLRSQVCAGTAIHLDSLVRDAKTVGELSESVRRLAANCYAERKPPKASDAVMALHVALSKIALRVLDTDSGPRTKPVTVVNLKTGEEFVYLGPPPRDAVNACYQQQVNKNFNTWDYEKTLKLVTLSKDKKTWCRGDFCALA